MACLMHATGQLASSEEVLRRSSAHRGHVDSGSDFVILMSGPAVTPEKQDKFRNDCQLRADNVSESSVVRALETYAGIVERSDSGHSAVDSCRLSII
jgi:hypothetical protein